MHLSAQYREIISLAEEKEELKNPWKKDPNVLTFSLCLTLLQLDTGFLKEEKEKADVLFFF